MKKGLFILFLAIAGIANAQKGTIRGTVLEEDNGLTIIGANAIVTNPLTGVSTDLDGKFLISMDPGVYTVKVSFISFQTIKIGNVEVKEGEITLLGNIRMKSSALELGEVVIAATATRKSEAALNAMKKKSVTMMDGISAQKMALTGDGTAIEAAQRVTGVSIEGGKYIYVRGLGDRYSKVTLNKMSIPGLDPDKNSLQMDIFPTNLIDNILVSKNFTAELPADFTGGLVNIETKSFPDEKIVSASIGISYNPSMHFNSNYLAYGGGSTDWLGMDDGTRDLPTQARSSNLPNPFDETDAEVIAFNRKFDTQLAASEETSLLDYSASFTIGNQIDLNKSKGKTKRNPKLGYIFSLSYKNDYKYYDDVTYSEYQRQIDPSANELIYSDRQEGVKASRSNSVGILTGLAYKTKVSKYRLTLMQLQNGESGASRFELDQNSSAVGRSGYTGRSHNLVYNERSLTNIFLNGKHAVGKDGWDVHWRISPTISRASDPDLRNTAFTYGVDTTFQNGNAGFPNRTWRELEEINLAGNLNLIKEHKFFDKDAKLMFGGAYLYKDRDYEILSYKIQFFGRQNWPGLDPNDVLDLSNTYPNVPNAHHVSNNASPNNNEYQAEARNIGFFVSEEFSIGTSLKVVVGLRVEKFEQRHTGVDQDFASGKADGNNLVDEVVLDETNLFPTINMIYTLAEEQNLRFAFAKTIARPSFKELSFAQILDPATGRTFNGSLNSVSPFWDGNLVSTDINNIDIRWEKFMQRGQIYSVSAFYKGFTNPIELVRLPINNTGFEYQARNVGNADLFGLEFEATKALEFLGEKFENFNVSGTLTLVRSRVEMSESELNARKENARVGEKIEDTREMAGQAPYVVNFGITYIDRERGISSGLFYNVKGKTLLIVGTGFVPDIYQVPFHSLNWGITKKIGEERKTSIDLKVDNILGDTRDEIFESYKASDKLFSSYNPGTAISIGVNHKF
ncbi:MAG: TonB-dependent receptor [Flavobacteriales bacterium]|nr:TonB-dependent receptor [Flavobacteriales bacterium]